MCDMDMLPSMQEFNTDAMLCQSIPSILLDKYSLWGSNPRPMAHKTIALTTELRERWGERERHRRRNRHRLKKRARATERNREDWLPGV